MIDKRERGILALTIASILILAGIWCIYLSPPNYYIPRGDPRDIIVWEDSFGRRIEAKTNITYTFQAEPSQYILIIPSLYSIVPKPGWIYPYYFIYDSKNNLLAMRQGDSWIWFNPPKKDQYKLIIHNPHNVKLYIGTTIESHKYNYRPLASIGYLLILLSLPIYGYGLTIIIQNPEKRKS